jgi:hypothetical protein
VNTVRDKSIETSLPALFRSLAGDVLNSFTEQIAGDRSGIEFPDILTFEEWTEELTRGLGRSMVERFIEVRSQQAKEMQMKCAKCGKTMERLKRSSWSRQTPWGEVRIKDDSYLYCRDCRASARPLHSYLGTDRETWSLLVQESAVDLATDESCQKAVEKLARHHRGVDMNRSTALRLLHRHGKMAREFVSGKLQAALMQAASESHRSEETVELEVEYDGGMIPVATLHPIPVEEGQSVETTPVRGLPKRRKACRWEEVKVGLAQVPGEVSRLYSVRPTHELDEAFDDLLALACLKGWTEDTKVRGIADGARYIRTRMEEAFHACPFRFILDRPHAKEHLSDVSKLLAEASLIEVSAEQWYTKALERIENEEIEQVVDELKEAFEQTQNDAIRREANYFERNKDAVAYAEYRENGWSSASSEVESSHRHIVQVRLKIPGAWWHPDNVPNILALRMLKANDWWDEYWKCQREQWAERAKGFDSKRGAPGSSKFPCQ